VQFRREAPARQPKEDGDLVRVAPVGVVDLPAGVDGRGLAVGQEEDRIGLVRAEAVERPAAGLGRVGGPRGVRVVLAEAVAAADDLLDLADAAAQDDLPGALVGRAEAQHLADHQHRPRGLGGRDHRVGVGQGRGHGLFAQDVLAGLCGGHGGLAVEMMG